MNERRIKIATLYFLFVFLAGCASGSAIFTGTKRTGMGSHLGQGWGHTLISDLIFSSWLFIVSS